MNVIFAWASDHPICFTILALPVVCTLCLFVGGMVGLGVSRS